MSAAPYRRRPSFVSLVVFPAAILGGVAIVVFAIFQLARHQGGHRPPPPEGYRPVIASPRPIPMYTQLTKENLWNPEEPPFKLIWVPAAAITSDMLTSFQQVAGRVLNHDKPADYGFTEADFYPRGTKPGWGAGVPEGKRGYTAVAEKISGLVGLTAGDHFDLMATIPIDPKAYETLQQLGPGMTQQLGIQIKLMGENKQARGRVIVQDGVVVVPLHTREVPTTRAGTLTSAAVQTMKPVQEVVVAVDPDEVGPLMEALAVGADLTCVARSNRSTDDHKSKLVPHEPSNPLTGGGGFEPLSIIKTVKGDTVGTEIAPKAGGKE
ncbi:MAG TPA: hypothetical protein VFF73_26635 [Planctomycetota bacterium]|nr:hypothetical protein [Planctomycetota bacterium]